MNARRVVPTYGLAAVGLMMALVLLLAAVAAADSGSGGTPGGLCVNGQVIDKAHVGIANIEVVAEPVDKSQAAIPIKTDKDGKFSFKDLKPGAWIFRVVAPPSWKAVTPTSLQFELTYAQSGCYDIRFKLEPLGCIIATKVDAAGKPLKDWTIKAVGVTDPEGKTDANGQVRFNDLTPGTYVVSETPPPESVSGVPPWVWKALTPTQVTVQVKPALNNDDCAKVQFKNELQPTSCITGTKVDDQHRPLAGWKIYAKSADGKEATPQVTDANGAFTFKNLTLGTWTISEELQTGWTAVTPASFTVQLTQAGTQCVQVRFKNRPPDICADGYKVDEKGVGLKGWTIKAYPKSDPAMELKTTTDQYGYYRFNGLTQDEWTFEVVPQVGWKPIGSDKVKLNIKTGMCVRVPTFRNQSPRGCVEGYKRDDLGVGLPGWNISLQPKGGAFYMHRDTDGTGYFRFDNLPMGEYEVWEEPQRGWIPTSPVRVPVTLTPRDDGACSRVEFSNKQVERDICIDGYKRDVWGNVGLPGWEIVAKNVATSAVITVTTDGLGYFRFPNLAPGTYEVKAIEKDGWVPAGAAVQYATVAWPPKLECTRLTFYDRQKTAGGTPPTCRLYHKVAPGQTLSGLAVWYGVKLDALMAANGISDPNKIYVGQRLCIP